MYDFSFLQSLTKTTTNPDFIQTIKEICCASCLKNMLQKYTCNCKPPQKPHNRLLYVCLCVCKWFQVCYLSFFFVILFISYIRKHYPISVRSFCSCSSFCSSKFPFSPLIHMPWFLFLFFFSHPQLNMVLCIYAKQR